MCSTSPDLQFLQYRGWWNFPISKKGNFLFANNVTLRNYLFGLTLILFVIPNSIANFTV